ncbi:hypothetical protein CAI21_22005 [Alkalilimnicola ehrlichii]|uniref:ATP-dependent Clp protease proteolytic subunit n=1 Tax=Alkalilimnicola ehrlichii TaxID=351052 RepID=A0A3E0WQN4_9GAMM|nr:head maturation protease, ClpP-related [Alkalilimnicola ehrlichii]RFA24351.1 hypothetical protein CAI21_22005 [Alkalilimnicola ehrlichii]RFA35138.1 hypothetical protein CAL65_13615 [Alkalilimnicola ehrlichii]
MNWLKVLNVATEREGEEDKRVAKMRIEGVVGSYNWLTNTDSTATTFIRTVDAMGDVEEIDLEINSPGGVVTDGVAITNYLRNHSASVKVTVIGEASSIASVIAQAADPGRLHMALGTTMFVHDPLTAAVGDADDFRHMADRLDKIRDSIVDIYQARSGMDREDIIDLMKADTTMTAEEAVTWGFADSTDEHLQAVACTEDLEKVLERAQMQTRKALRSSGESNASEVAKLRRQIDELKRGPEPAAAEAVIAACAEADIPALAVDFVKAKLPMSEVQSRIEMIGKVRDVFAAAELDPGPILSHIDDPVEMLRIAVTNAKAANEQHIDNSLNQNSESHQAGWDKAFSNVRGDQA